LSRSPGRGAGGRKRGGRPKRGAGSKRAAGSKRGAVSKRVAGGSAGLLSRRRFLGVSAATGAVLAAGTLGARTGFRRLNRIGAHDPARLAELRAGTSTLLFDRYPALADMVPWRPLGTFPTPVAELPTLAGASDVRLFVKREDLSSSHYGGNKVRKLEHFLADAAAAERTTLITIGSIGSNHALATAIHGARLGFDVRVAVFDQPVTEYVDRNVRGMARAGARLEYSGGVVGAALAARRLYAATGAPYFIMPGGSERLGTIGYVNAGLELAAQVRAGALPEPDRLFLAAGTCGTAAGLIVGCRLAGLRTRVTAVRVAEPVPANAVTIRAMANDVATFLHQAEPAMPRIRIGFGDFDVVSDQLGRGYGHTTAAGRAALEWAAPTLELESTYTAKALAGCLDYCRGRARPGETVLFWNTVNSAPVAQAAALDALPAELRAVLERAAVAG
jgi:1-aminocyclopropane-1-carboxylate deaminase/D-cysteine desulfhydrase-like pyridoxal-dependent ACC family enzyme